MPAPIKLVLSIIVLCAAGAAYYFQASAGQTLTPWLILFLGLFMVVALWLFPETKGKGKGSR